MDDDTGIHAERDSIINWIDGSWGSNMWPWLYMWQNNAVSDYVYAYFFCVNRYIVGVGWGGVEGADTIYFHIHDTVFEASYVFTHTSITNMEIEEFYESSMR